MAVKLESNTENFLRLEKNLDDCILLSPVYLAVPAHYFWVKSKIFELNTIFRII